MKKSSYRKRGEEAHELFRGERGGRDVKEEKKRPTKGANEKMVEGRPAAPKSCLGGPRKSVQKGTGPKKRGGSPSRDEGVRKGGERPRKGTLFILQGNGRSKRKSLLTLCNRLPEEFPPFLGTNAFSFKIKLER